MLVHVRCPTCEGLAQIDDKYLGAQVRCPRCKEPFPARMAPSESMNAPAVLAARPDGAVPVPPRPAPESAPAVRSQPGPPAKKQAEVAFDTEERMRPLSLERVPWARVDRVMPAQPVPFLLAVLGIAVGCWLVGFLLAPIKSGFLAAHEWQVQPFFLATHFLCLRLFVTCYTRNFLAGAAHMDLPEGEAVRRVKQILGPTGGLIALGLALPLCAYNIFVTLPGATYLEGAEAYGGGLYKPVDLFLCGIWCAEWFLNAYIWVVLVGFLVLTMWVLWKHRFRATIEVLLHEKQYRPFLLMSAQGATIVLLFAAVNGFYVWYAEGELDDYIGLGITGTLLLLGFGPPWMQLKSNVENAVNQETFRLQEKLVEDMRRRAEAGDNGKPVSTADLAERLDSALAVLRTMYLERMHKELGRAEGKALLLKLLAPAGSIGWKVIRPLIMGG